MSKHKLSRREFMGSASCAAIGTATFFSSFLNLGMANALAKPKNNLITGSDYKALVCILLAGGNDSFNMLIPRSGADYGAYSQTRSNLAIAQNQILPISPTAYAVQELGVHPSMPEVQQLFDAGNLAFVSNVGTLVEPTNKTQFENNGVRLPLGLFSHSDQIQHWQTSLPQSRTAVGWGGRMADILHAGNSNQKVSMNISLSGKNVFQAGNQVVEYTVRPTGTGSSGMDGYGGPSLIDQVKTTAVKNLMEHQYQDVFKKSYSDVITNAQEGHELFSSSVGAVNMNTTFSANTVSQSMQMVAKTIAARNQLGMSRQTFFISFGGWDHHDEVLNAQAGMLTVLSKALKEFDDAMKELNVHNDVTTFTISDFGRTLTSNGNGTDHAWGGNAMVMGGAVKGKEVYGTYPSLALNGNLDVGGGVLIPTTSADEYFAELALWFGVPTSELAMVLPNIGNFYSTQSGPPIGFMNS